MRRFLQITVLLGLLTLAFASCTKENGAAPPTPPSSFELVFGFEADEDVSKFVAEVSENNGHTWREVGVVLPVTGTPEYILPVQVPQGAMYFFRVRGETTAGTLYYTAVVAARG